MIYNIVQKPTYRKDAYEYTMSSSSSSLYLHDRTAACPPACPIEKITLWVGFPYLMPGSKTNEGVAKDKESNQGLPVESPVLFNA